jgi:hypothetical protein
MSYSSLAEAIHLYASGISEKNGLNIEMGYAALCKELQNGLSILTDDDKSHISHAVETKNELGNFFQLIPNEHANLWVEIVSKFIYKEFNNETANTWLAALFAGEIYNAVIQKMNQSISSEQEITGPLLHSLVVNQFKIIANEASIAEFFEGNHSAKFTKPHAQLQLQSQIMEQLQPRLQDILNLQKTNPDTIAQDCMKAIELTTTLDQLSRVAWHGLQPHLDLLNRHNKCKLVYEAVVSKLKVHLETMVYQYVMRQLTDEIQGISTAQVAPNREGYEDKIKRYLSPFEQTLDYVMLNSVFQTIWRSAQEGFLSALNEKNYCSRSASELKHLANTVSEYLGLNQGATRSKDELTAFLKQNHPTLSNADCSGILYYIHEVDEVRNAALTTANTPEKPNAFSFFQAGETPPVHPASITLLEETIQQYRSNIEHPLIIIARAAGFSNSEMFDFENTVSFVELLAPYFATHLDQACISEFSMAIALIANENTDQEFVKALDPETKMLAIIRPAFGALEVLNEFNVPKEIIDEMKQALRAPSSSVTAVVHN